MVSKLMLSIEPRDFSNQWKVEPTPPGSLVHSKLSALTAQFMPVLLRVPANQAFVLSGSTR